MRFFSRFSFVFVACILFAGLLVVGGSTLATSSQSHQDDFRSFLNNLWIHDGVSHENMVVFPITLRGQTDNTEYLTLDEAVENGFVKISEIGSGSVPTLRLEIKSTKPMFFMGGEVVTGAKQDRILRHDLVFRGSTGSYDLPVYCVEQGRWTSVSDKFSAGKILGSNRVRQAAVMEEGQSTVWHEVNEQNETLRRGLSDRLGVSFA